MVNEKILEGIISVVIVFGIILCLLLTSVDIIIFRQPNYFRNEYEKYHVEETIGIDMDSLQIVTTHMLRYLEGKEETLDMAVQIEGEEREFFNEKEKRHMVDVQKLMVLGRKVRSGTLLIVSGGFLFLFLIKGRLGRIFFHVMAAIVAFVTVLLVTLAALISQNFYQSFVVFHELIFTNDDWILNPAESRLINMVPQGFFEDTALRIGVLFGFGMLIMFLIALAGIALSKK